MILSSLLSRILSKFRLVRGRVEREEIVIDAIVPATAAFPIGILKSRHRLTCDELPDGLPTLKLTLPQTTVTTSKRAAWSQTLQRATVRALRASGTAVKVFVALALHSNPDGYSWLLVSTLQKLTGIKKPRTIYAAVKELAALDVLHHRRLIARIGGKNAPNIYRIGAKVGESLPENAAARYVLAPEKSEKPISQRFSEGRPAPKGHVAKEERSAAERQVGDLPFKGTTPPAPKGQIELEVRGNLKKEGELGALTRADARHHRFSTNTQTDDDLSVRERAETLQSKAKKLLLDKGHSRPVIEIAMMRVENLARAKGSVPRSVAYFVKSVQRSLEDPREVQAIATIVEHRLSAGVALTAPLEPHETHDGPMAEPEPRDLKTFEQFYASYPNQIGKPVALREWMNSVKANDSARDILDGLERWKRSPEWRCYQGQYIPSPTKFIFGRQWMDTPMSQLEEQREVVRLQEQVEALMREIDETDRTRQTPGCSNPDSLIEHRKLLVEQLVKLQRRLQAARY